MKVNIFYKGKHKFCWPVFIITIGIAIFGIIMIYSASSYNAEKLYNDEMYFVVKQIIGVALGIGAMILFYFIDYRILQKFWLIVLAIGIIVLIIVFIPGIGIESYGAKRWIGFGAFSFQASEIAKFCFIIFSATYMVKFKDKMNTFRGAMPVVIVGGVMCVLIMLEPNMSITICMGVVLITMLLIGGIRLKHLFLLMLPALALIPLLILIEPYRLARLMAFIDPWASPQGEGFQLIQSLYSLGNGGWFGVGLFNSRQKYSFLPFSESDFIFSIIGEEVGFIGALCLIFAFCILIFFCIRIAIQAQDRFGCLLVIGIVAILTIQVILNIAVVTGAIPPTGLPLPFVSAGSTSLVMFMGAIGVVLNVNRQNGNIVYI